MSVFEDIKLGLQQAIVYEKAKDATGMRINCISIKEEICKSRTKDLHIK